MSKLRIDEVLDRLNDGSWMCRHCGNFEWSISVEVCPRCKKSQGEPTDEENAEYQAQLEEGEIEMYRMIRKGLLP